ncbi:PflA [Desulforapulum autotrophicum HRM2]|uniref:PflA n=1 Tax=Desulforapulum autotrophicum (strain ATCC 43914 / DSM 3382 / VKM B-1955 / HRM2) TaxID=177437 RepID=C0QHP0_DESAH|nr:anaerobic ribonucleoside-triphosphate reductase activating protein [Desulforapulum autotrophicum]ACN13598.1 PflA [Desulforapulum autotrophicum HRM2]
MKIGGFQKNSMIDFPGLVASVVFTTGCNFVCPYCHNPDLVDQAKSREIKPIGKEEIFAFLNKRQGLIDGVVITGGEPTLQPDLAQFIRDIKALGFRVKLDTNGSRPEIIKSLLEKGLVDYIAMDIKSNLDGYYLAAGRRFDVKTVSAAIKIIMAQAPAYEFRTTCVKPLIDQQKMEDIGAMIKGAKHYFLQPCSRNVAMLNPSFFEPEDRFFSNEEMLALKATVSPWVNNCSIRH